MHGTVEGLLKRCNGARGGRDEEVGKKRRKGRVAGRERRTTRLHDEGRSAISQVVQEAGIDTA